MPRWSITREWEGQTAVIIGGGSSLAKFDFSVLKGMNTIGCNDAFRLGPDVVKICLFGDATWYHRNKHELLKFPGRRVTCAPTLLDNKSEGLLTLERNREGIWPPPTIGWNHSTGAAAVNVAVQLGARLIYLLGFDMSRNQTGRTHWHDYQLHPVRDESYRRFIRGFNKVHQGVTKYPVKVYNVTDGSSKLPYFDRISFEEFLKQIGT